MSLNNALGREQWEITVRRKILLWLVALRTVTGKRSSMRRRDTNAADYHRSALQSRLNGGSFFLQEQPRSPLRQRACTGPRRYVALAQTLVQIHLSEFKYTYYRLNTESSNYYARRGETNLEVSRDAAICCKFHKLDNATCIGTISLPRIGRKAEWLVKKRAGIDYSSKRPWRIIFFPTWARKMKKYATGNGACLPLFIIGG